jgi:hypothetical protein
MRLPPIIAGLRTRQQIGKDFLVAGARQEARQLTAQPVAQVARKIVLAGFEPMEDERAEQHLAARVLRPFFLAEFGFQGGALGVQLRKSFLNGFPGHVVASSLIGRPILAERSRFSSGRASVHLLPVEISSVLLHNSGLSFIASILPLRDTERRKSVAIELRRAHLRVATQLSAPPAWGLAGRRKQDRGNTVGDLPFEHEASFEGVRP